jgi:hypothetical protein
MNNCPVASIWLDVPEDCRIACQFTGDGDVQFTLGEWHEGQVVLFERPALERFVQLATALLEKPTPIDSKAPSVVLESPAA